MTVRLAALRAADLAGEGAAGTGVDLSTKRQRGALYTSSTPLSGVPVWRQGQGALGGQDLSISMPGFALAAGNGIPLSHADLGLEPASGSWQVVVPIPGGASAATVTVSDFVGVTYTARFETSTTEPAPDVSAQADNDGITVSVPLPIPISKKEGLYCGYVETNVTVRIEDIPTCLIRGLTPIARSLGIHDRSADDQAFSLAPTLPPGFSLVEHPIHLLPINPVDTSLFTKITGARDCLLYHDIPKACHGHAPFSVVPPGFYTVRGWADYGAPTESELQVNTSGVWTTQTVTDELGGRLAYTKYKTLLLARAPECSETYGQWDDWSIQAPGEIANPDKWKDCTEDWLEDRTPPDADVTFTYHAATAGFIVSGADLPEPIRMNLGFLRKAADASVATQVIDIIRPCSDLSFTGFQSPELFRPSDLIPGLPGPGDVINIPDPLDVGWHPVCLQFVCANLPGPILIDPGIPNIPTDSVEDDPSIPWQGSCANAESLLAQYTDSEDSASEGYVTGGWARYDFNLPQPNYTASFDLNFSYEVNRAVILALVIIGFEARYAIITPQGTFESPPISSSSSSSIIDLSDLPAAGFRSGDASFNWEFLPRGTTRGTITFAFIPDTCTAPLDPTGRCELSPAWAKLIDDPAANKALSFRLSTWSPTPWPGFNFLHRGTPTQTVACDRTGLAADDCGHTFRVLSGFTPATYDATGTYLGGQIEVDSAGNPTRCRVIQGPERKAEVCEDWTMMVHAPRPEPDYATHPSAAIMDVVDVGANFTTTVSDLVDAGGRLYVPEAGTATAPLLLSFSGGVLDATSKAALLGANVRSSRSLFEQLLLPTRYLAKHPGELEVCINDGLQRATSICSLDQNGDVVEVPVPCVPKVPPLLTDPCRATPGGSSRARIGPYVNY